MGRFVPNSTPTPRSSTIRVPCGPWYPDFSLALLDEPLLHAVGFQTQPHWVRIAAERAIRARSIFVRLLRVRPLTDEVPLER